MPVLLPYLTLLLFLLIVALALATLVIVMMAGHLLRPSRMTDGKALYFLKRLSPTDIGLRYEKIDFHVRDQATGKPLHIAGWWMPAAIWSDQTAIIIHGYSDAKVGGIAWAPTFHALGRHVLAIDLRAHGDSGGKLSTGGYFERFDLEQVIDELRQIRPAATRRIALFGVSLGATVAAAVAANRDDICAVVMESPYTDYRDAIVMHGRRLAMPLEWAYGLAATLAERMSGAKFDEVRPIDLIPKIRAPLLVIHSAADTFVPHEQIVRIADAIAKRPPRWPSRHVVVPEVEHTRSLLSDPAAYQELLRTFLGDC